MKIPKPIQMQGVWWVPGKPDERIHGTLEISGFAAITLELLGNIQMRSNTEFKSFFGEIQDGKRVSLLNCFISRQNSRSPGMSGATIDVEIAFFGVHTEDPFSINITSAVFNSEGLGEWLGISGAEVKSNWKRRQYTLKYKLPKPRNYRIGRDLTLSMVFEASLPFGGSVHETKVVQKASMKLRIKRGVPVEEVFWLLYRINSFLCFAYDQPTALVSVRLFSQDEVFQVNGQTVEQPMEVYYATHPQPENPPLPGPFNVLLPFKLIEKNLNKILSTWLNLYDHLEPAMESFFSATTAKHPYAFETRFLTLAQGLETLHRRSSTDTVMPKREFEDLVKELITACPDKWKNWLRTRLMYGNELSLRQRMKELFNPYVDFFGKVNVKTLIQDVVTTRNYLTHFDESLESAAKSGEELWILCQKLEALFQMQILNRLGFTVAHIESIEKSYYRFRQKLANRSPL